MTLPPAHVAIRALIRALMRTAEIVRRGINKLPTPGAAPGQRSNARIVSFEVRNVSARSLIMFIKILT